MKARTLIAVLGALMLAVAVVFVWMAKRNVTARRRAAEKAAEARRAEERERAPRPSFRNPLFLKVRKAHANRKWLTADQRARLLGALMRARKRRASTGPAPAEPGAPAPEASRSEETSPPAGVLDKEYIRKQIKEIIPLVKECYDLALHDHPGLQGNLTVKFVIGGEPEVGGLVEQSDIIKTEGMPENTILNECVRETMYALEFEPPQGGGRVTVKYPFKFRTAGTPPRAGESRPSGE